MDSITRELVESSVHTHKLASSLKIKLGASLSSRSTRFEVSGDLNKLIALIQASGRFNTRANSDYEPTTNIGILKTLVKKDLSRLGSMSSADLGFLVSRLENLASLLNR